MRWVHGALLMTVLWPAVAMSQQAAPEAIPGQQGAGQAGQGTALPTPSGESSTLPAALPPGEGPAPVKPQAPGKEEGKEKLVATVHAGDGGLHIRFPEHGCVGKGEEGKAGADCDHDLEAVDVGPSGVHVRTRKEGAKEHAHKVVHVTGPTPGAVAAGVLGGLALAAGTTTAAVAGLALVADVVWLAVLHRDGRALTTGHGIAGYVTTPLALAAPLVVAGVGGS